MNKAGKKHVPAMVYNSHINSSLFSGRLKQAWPWWRVAFTCLALTGLFLSTVLSWQSLMGGQMAGCGSESPCGQVLNSRWSVLAGVLPVSGLALGVYLAIFIAGFFIGPYTVASIRRLTWKALVLLAGSVAGSAVWFIVIQKWIIGEFCPFCMVIHTIGLLLASIIVGRVFTETGNQQENSNDKGERHSGSRSFFLSRRVIAPLPAIGLLLAGLALAGMLAAFQIGYTPLPNQSDAATQNNMPLIDYNKAPIVGLSDAPHVVTLLFDYQCSHCQKIHFMLDEAVKHYAGELAFILCPAPLHSKCNAYIPQGIDIYINSCELARIGLAVWFADRKVFPEFDNWMFSYESGSNWLPRNPEAAIAKAVELIGQVKFDKALVNPQVDEYLQICTDIYGQTIRSGNGGVPKMLYDSRWVVPEPYNTDDLILILQKSLGVPEF